MERERRILNKFSLGTNTVEVINSGFRVLGAQIKSKNGFSFK